VRGILSPAPFDLVDFLFDLKGFQVVEFGFMRLELSVKLVLACFFLLFVSHPPSRSLRSHQAMYAQSRSAQIEPLCLPYLQLPDSYQYDRIRQLRLYRLYKRISKHPSSSPTEAQNIKNSYVMVVVVRYGSC
jgi:hypothetical protein